MNGSGWILLPVLLLGLLVGGGVAAAVAHWDDDDEPRVVRVVAPAGDASQASPQVIEVRDRDWRGHGFFPGFFIFPLLWILLIFLVVRGLFWRGGRGGHGPWGGRFEEWHRQQHQGEQAPPSPPAASA